MPQAISYKSTAVPFKNKKNAPLAIATSTQAHLGITQKDRKNVSALLPPLNRATISSDLPFKKKETSDLASIRSKGPSILLK